ncbi:peptidoglycan-recognition protein [Frankliniella occidentalis]|nr:peptidoglycan-recognition protein [Frankliniella occidentalis]
MGYIISVGTGEDGRRPEQQRQNCFRAPSSALTCVCPRIVPRDEWGARPPKAVLEMHNPVSTVVIHHTYSPSYCASAAACEEAMRSMQTFAVGGDGRVYKGRGWNRVGAHAPPYNQDSIGITLIGDWTAQAPPKEMLDAVSWLIRCGVDTGRIAPDYQLIGHRQARDTACPGDGLFAVVRTMPRWTATPAPPKHHGLSAAAPAAPALDHLSSDLPIPAAAVPEAPAAATAAAAPVVLEVSATPSPAARAGTYDPSTPVASRDAVEVRQLNKRASLRAGSLWDRLVLIWEHEAARQESEAAAAASQDAVVVS